MQRILPIVAVILFFSINPESNAHQPERPTPQPRPWSEGLSSDHAQHPTFAEFSTMPIIVASGNTDFIPPESGSEWRIRPARIGKILSSQIKPDHSNGFDSVRYQQALRNLSLSIFNPSTSSVASVDVKCGDHLQKASGAPITVKVKNGDFRKIKVPPDNNIDADARCEVSSDIPVIVTAFIEEKIVQTQSPDDSGVIMQMHTVPWPAFRLNGPK